MKVAIIDYGAGNVQSVRFAIKRLGVDTVLTNSAPELSTSDRVIFPGVGHANSAMLELRKNKLTQVITNLKQPVLGICLGMQLMCSYSEEGNTEGLGIFKEKVIRFKKNNDTKIPHMGWNKLEQTNSSLLKGVENEFMYFVHSYYVPKGDNAIALTNYQVPFSAAMQKDNFHACQFHPEKSGSKGEQILKNFLQL